MCLINFQFDDHPIYKLILAANRDEFYLRPTEALHLWEDEPGLLAGRDLVQMGTWLGITKTGRVAALTNFRDPSLPDKDKISRGAIVRNFLTSDMDPQLFLEALNPKDYAGFNLLAGDSAELFYYNNVNAEITKIEPGIHGLSNHFLDTPWPKVVKGKGFLRHYLTDRQEVQTEDLFAFLKNADQAEAADLPDTGIGQEMERVLSPMFINTPEYGTRSSTVLLIRHDGQATIAERSYEKGFMKTENRYEFNIKSEV